MLIAALVLVIVGVTAVIFYQRRKQKKTEAFLRMVHDAGVEGRWAEIITQAHQTMPAEEVQKIERALYMHALRCHQWAPTRLEDGQARSKASGETNGEIE